MPGYFVQLAVYRQNDAKSRALLRGISHEAENENEANEVFHEVQKMIAAAMKATRKRHQGREPQAAPPEPDAPLFAGAAIDGEKP